LKQKGISKRAKTRAQSERAKQELKGKLLPFSTFFFFSMVFFFFSLTWEEGARRKRLKQKGKSGSQK